MCNFFNWSFGTALMRNNHFEFSFFDPGCFLTIDRL